MSKILRNMAKCLDCEDVIESKSVHDFRTCKCGNLSVDGGLDYIKRSSKNFNFEDLSKFNLNFLEILDNLKEKFDEKLKKSGNSVNFPICSLNHYTDNVQFWEYAKPNKRLIVFQESDGVDVMYLDFDFNSYKESASFDDILESFIKFAD